MRRRWRAYLWLNKKSHRRDNLDASRDTLIFFASARSGSWPVLGDRVSKDWNQQDSKALSDMNGLSCRKTTNNRGY
jgi:hypothetical protein